MVPQLTDQVRRLERLRLWHEAIIGLYPGHASGLEGQIAEKEVEVEEAYRDLEEAWR